MPTTLEIARKAKPHQIYAIANQINVRADELEVFGSYKAKVSLKALERRITRPNAKLICVTGMTPTREGDGKTCTAIGLTQAIGYLKKKAMLCLREPSLAPVLGHKGGGTGGGYAQVVPMDDINLHFTGDFHAVEKAHNLLAAAIENSIHYGNPLKIDAKSIFWRRAMDIPDRQLRDVTVGLAKACKFTKFKTGFDVTAASEVMAALSLSSSIADLKRKLSKISVAFNKEGKLVTAGDLKVDGAMALLLREAMMPNLVQTLEGQPVFMHTGPYANVSHGNNSAVSTLMALKTATYVVTECGFGSDLGLEKFFDIVCPQADLKPNVVVLVVSVKALRSHAPDKARSGKLLDVFREGFANVEKHIQNVRKFGVDAVVAINRFPDDSEESIRTVRDFLRSIDVECAVSDAVTQGGKGGVELAEKVLKMLNDKPGQFRPLYDESVPLEDKIRRIATEIYGAADVVYTAQAKADLETIHRLKIDKLPINIAKTPYSLSDDPELKGAPAGWKLKIHGLRPYTGAGFLLVLAGKMLLMPGLPESPMFEKMSVTDEGEAVGLF